MFDRPYSRTLEAEADKIGLQLAAKVKCLAVQNTQCPSHSRINVRCLNEVWHGQRMRVELNTIFH